MSSSSPPPPALRCIAESAEVLFRVSYGVSYVPVFTFILAPGPRSLINPLRTFFLLLPIEAVLMAFPVQTTLPPNSTLTTALRLTFPVLSLMEAPTFPS